jgi:superfamily II DNA or RNA helicase
MMKRYSTRRQQISETFLNEKLKNAKTYDRIAGYFSSSLLEVAGEAIEQVDKIRIICNVNLEAADVDVAKANVLQQKAFRTEGLEQYSVHGTDRFQKLYNLLTNGKLEVRVLPNERFGLLHGKAGVITYQNNNQTSFLGSVNETYSGWAKNYELLWEDDSKESIDWVQEEFDALWRDHAAIPLSQVVIEEIRRIANRKVIEHNTWIENPDPASVVIEAPVYRKEYGLWSHQKTFVTMVFEDHVKFGGARFVLADQVGLGKTLQLALSAQLIALTGERPVLIIVPKTLCKQWMEEFRTLLDAPCAMWDGSRWIDESGVEYPRKGASGIRECPRKIAIVSAGLMVRGGEAANYLKEMTFDLVILDEAHRARRKNLGPSTENEPANPNNLLRFIRHLSARTKSLLLATATPVQIHPIEGYDLLSALSVGSIGGSHESVFGNQFSEWNRKIPATLDIVLKREREGPVDAITPWNWLCNPIPKSEEHPVFSSIRNSLHLNDAIWRVNPNKWDDLSAADKQDVTISSDELLTNHNPFIRQIIRRTRDYLEATINSETGRPYMDKIYVDLDEQTIELGFYLGEIYTDAELFCQILSKRLPTAGIIKTLLLRRIGSSMIAGLNTARALLNKYEDVVAVESYNYDEDESDEGRPEVKLSDVELEAREVQLLEKIIAQLEKHFDSDPKKEFAIDYLINKGWKDDGCIVFSQYYDSIRWFAESVATLLPNEKVGLYAGSGKSGLFFKNDYQPIDRELLKKLVQQGEVKILCGTDAASEGLNLQRLGTLINLDLPWNPSRLEQRKGRIQRIGQTRETIKLVNIRYGGSVEDRVHQLLSGRLHDINKMFGQLPDVLKDVWIDIAENKIEEAQKRINSLPEKHPFDIKYAKHVEPSLNWEKCAIVLNDDEKKMILKNGW